jgi:hypothetical protein
VWEDGGSNPASYPIKPAKTLYLAMTGLLALVRTPELPNQPPRLFLARALMLCIRARLQSCRKSRK